ncbi:MAG: glycosyl transferase family 2 [Lysobacteraceae bacterium]|nr:MAG: glycosyl transferase family 2 [Xanthomonadaceae bacterium]
MNISVVINTLNEEKNIADCISSVLDFADEIVVCDMHSDDRTAEIARSMGAAVISHPRLDFVEPARHTAISAANGRWVLVLDADERVTPQLAEKLESAANSDDYDVVCLWNLFWFFGGWVRQGGFFTGDWARFFRKQHYLDSYSEDENFIHRCFRAIQTDGRVLNLPNDCYLKHLAYPSVEGYVHKTLGRYAAIEARLMHEAGQRFSLFGLIWEPVKEAMGRYLLRRGFLDGMRGLILATLYGGFKFLIWANLWSLENSEKQPKDA